MVAAALLTGSDSGPAILWASLQRHAMESGPSPRPTPEAAALLSSLLSSLLDDFDQWFKRGEELLISCPESVMTQSDQIALARRLEQGKKAIAASRALVAASEQPMAVSMEAMKPWHGLVTEVWGLSARIAAQKP